MKQKVEEKLRAIELRKRGLSLDEIVEELGVAKSSASVWVRNVALTDKARKRLLTKIKLGQLVAAENKRERTAAKIEEYKKEALDELSLLKLDKTYKKLICALLYWCEGAKNSLTGVRFTNSDPILVRSFLTLFRESFNLDESKLRVGIHLHDYHDPRTQLVFWSKATEIKPSQFIKPYLKPNTGKRIREGYPGCATIYYHDINTARRLIAVAKEFMKITGA